MQHEVTVFEDILDTTTPWYYDVNEVFDRIREGRSKDLVEAIRKEKDKDQKKELKKKLPGICFSGKFSKRADSAILKHSGLICLDFDGFKTKTRMKEVREQMIEDSYVMSVFVSPSGVGLKVIVKIPEDVENHREYFNALEDWFGIDEFDTSCKNESRVCYESYDPKIYINPESEVWEDRKKEEVREVYKESPEDVPATIPIRDEDKIVEKLLVWWNKNYGFVPDNWNNNLYILAGAYCHYGIPEGNTINRLHRMANEEGSMPLQDIKTLTRSAYKDNQFGIKVLEDTNKVDNLASRVKQGATKKEIKNELVKDGVDLEIVDKIVDKIEDKANEKVQYFWRKSDRGVVSLRQHLFRDFLIDNGFYKFYPDGGKNFIFVRKVSNRVENITNQNIKDYILKYLEDRVQDYSIWDFFAENTKYFKDDFLSMLPSIEIDFVQDTASESYLFFRNVAVKITDKDVIPVEYESLNGWVWKEQMIDRDFDILKECTTDFEKFIGNVGGNDKKRIATIESTIGFLLHSYKDPKYCPAVIINDEIISDDPEGGTGKGIFMHAISHIRKMVSIDGKRFTFDRSFPYQTVQQDTQVLLFDDVKAQFDFESLFSVITEGITLEKKNKDAIKIPFESSPKIGITTNYGIRGKGNSFVRRKWEIEFSQFYTADFTPAEEFGRRLFDDWDDQDWLCFDNYMIGCLKSYLKTGFKKSEFKNVHVRRFISETNHDFYEWITTRDNQYAKEGSRHVGQEVYQAFIMEHPDYGPGRKLSITMPRFYKWVRSYAKFGFGTELIDGRDSNGKFFEFKLKDPQQKLKV